MACHVPGHNILKGFPLPNLDTLSTKLKTMTCYRLLEIGIHASVPITDAQVWKGKAVSHGQDAEGQLVTRGSTGDGVIICSHQSKDVLRQESLVRLSPGKVST